MRRLLSAALVVGVCAAAFALTAASSDSSGGKRYRIVFDNAFGLVDGGDFRVAGVKVGKTTSMSVLKRPHHAPKAVVTAEVDQPGFGDFRADASCDIKPQSLIGEYYVDCQPGHDVRRLPHATVPVEHTTSTIPQDLINDILRRPYRERLRLIITELGTGLAGRPQDLAQVLRRAHPGLRETTRVLRILGRQSSVIEHFIGDADTVVAQLERNKRDVARWFDKAGDAAAISATRRPQIQQSLHRLPRFLDELRPTMSRLGALATEQTPLLADARRAAPSLDTFFSRLGPFAKASTPALRSLGRASAVGTRAFRTGRQEIKELRALSKGAPGFAKPLRQFLQTLDERRRAAENDVHATPSSPPAPDPTAASGTTGFTGFEALWNYFFYQALATNGYDDVGHVLRAGVVAGLCSNLDTKYGDDSNDAEKYAKCKQWMGPHQPAITAPDPTDSGAAGRRLQREQGKPASRQGERRGPGQPQAGPVPGQRDLSKPQVVLPPQVKSLLENLSPKAKLPAPKDLPRQLPGDDQQRANQLLDYLLGP